MTGGSAQYRHRWYNLFAGRSGKGKRKMSKISVSLCLCVLLSFVLSCGGGGSVTPAPGGGTANITVMVKEFSNGNQFWGNDVTVTFYSGSTVAYQGVTDDNGSVDFPSVKAGKYRIVADTNVQGYPVELSVNIPAGKRLWYTLSVYQ